MARLESVAVGGYFPTPPHLVPLMAELLTVSAGTHGCAIADPCAGEGAAILSLGQFLGSRREYYTCEMEQARHLALKAGLHEAHEYSSVNQALHGDAFQVDIPIDRMSVLYLNPPYDTDPVHGRLEQRFLDRFIHTMTLRGVLLFVIPYYALKASAVTLATHFTDLQCFRFPDEDFASYRQVVLMGQKSETLPGPDPELLQQVLAWSESTDGMPVLGDPAAPYTVPESGYSGARSTKWVMRELDLVGLVRKVRPWRQMGRSGILSDVPHVLPSVPVEDLMFRSFPLATAPRPAHIAAGIASGLFNGRRVTAQDPRLPDLLVKGVFDREYVTVEEKLNKEGEVTAAVQVQQPRLVTTVLNLRTQEYTTLKHGTATGSHEVSEMTIEDLLNNYGPSLMQVMSQQCPVSYDPKRDSAGLPLAPIGRPLYKAQENAAKALTQLLGGTIPKKVSRRATLKDSRHGKAAILLGEIGSGKTSVVLSVGSTIGKRMLVMCPPHLLDSWRDETQTILPDAEFRVLENVQDLDNLRDIPAHKQLVAVVSRETAKLGHGWEAVTGQCPKCGAELPKMDLAKKRARCEHQTIRPKDQLGRASVELALKLSPHASSDPRVTHLLKGRFIRQWIGRFDKKPYAWTGLESAFVDQIIDTVVAAALASGDEEPCRLACLLLAAENNHQRIARVVRQIPADVAYYLQDFAKALALLLPTGSDLQNELREAPVFTREHWGSFDGSVKALRQHSYTTRVGELKIVNNQVCLNGKAVGSLAMALSLLSHLTKAGRFHTSRECGEPLFQAVPEPRRFPLSRYICKRYPDLFDFLVLDECFVAGTSVSGTPIEKIKVGDSVASYDELTGRQVLRKVSRLWKKVPTSLVRIRFSNGRHFVCTPNHPIYTPQGWVPAGLLIPGTPVIQESRGSSSYLGSGGAPTTGIRLLQQEVLQGRSGKHGTETGCRSGRPLSQITEMEIPRSTKNRGFNSTRVDSVEVLERGSDGTFGGMCSDGYVYNLEIEGTHTYFAEGILVHNCHEYATDGSAQERSAHRLTALGIPTVMMTGSIMNGYAESLFSNMWALSRDFRQEFAREDRPRFVERYGYLKRILTDRDRESKEVVEFGSHTDRVERSERTAGNAPGILPLFLFRHLLPISVTLHKADLAIDLPPCRQIKCLVTPDAELQKAFKSLQQSLITQIRQDQFEAGFAGKLFGALAELPSYLDRATLDTGNQEDGSYEIRYPDSIGGGLVAKGESFPLDTLSAKERWMLDTLRAELAEGRNVMVFGWHVSLLPRLARIISRELGEEVPVLYADKVATHKRQEWINKNVIRKQRRILIANPVGIQTGLNNLVHFATEIWMENPACNPHVFRQAIGRVDRIGAKLETRIYTPIFAGTLQVQLHDLLLRKVAVAVATDGLDPESVLLAAGALDDGYLSGLSIGKQLWNLLNAN